MPTRFSSALSHSAVSPPSGGLRGPAGLVAAVAGIVAIAAERARAAGDLGALRDAIERVLDGTAPPAADPREPGGADLPRIADADVALEEPRLRALLARLQPG